MKILYVSTISNTVNAFLIPHIKMLVNQGYQVDVAFKTNQKVSDELNYLNCKIYEIDFNRSIFQNNFIDLTKKIKRIVSDGKYDIVHTHTPIASAIVRLACKQLSSVKVVYTAHGFHFYKGAPLRNWLTFYPVEKYLARYTDAIITMNSEDFIQANNFNSTIAYYIPGVGIDIDKDYDRVIRNKKRESLRISNDSALIVSVGELNKNKNHQIVIKALALLKKRKFDYIICGEGEELNQLKKLVNDLELNDNIHFVGFRSDVLEILQVSDIFIFPSYREGLPRSLMEAMSVGLPAIVSNIRGNIDLIDNNKGGFIFNETNEIELANKIMKLLDNKNLINQFGHYNLEKIKKFSLENVLIELKQLYRLLSRVSDKDKD